MKRTVCQAVRQADLRTSNMNKIKWLWKQLRTVMLLEFFLLYLSLLRVIPET